MTLKRYGQGEGHTPKQTLANTH